MSFVSFRIHVPVEPNEQEKQKIKIFLSLYPVPFVLEGLNTLLVQRVLAEPRHFQAMQAADWRALTPLFYQHVNPYGTFRLDMNERMHIDEEEAIA